MLKIGLKRFGCKKNPHFRVVVTDGSKVIDYKVGHYHPAEQENKVTINKEKFEEFVKNGAQLTEKVAVLADSLNIACAKKFLKVYTPRKPGEFAKKKGK